MGWVAWAKPFFYAFWGNWLGIARKKNGDRVYVPKGIPKGTDLGQYAVHTTVYSQKLALGSR